MSFFPEVLPEFDAADEQQFPPKDQPENPQQQQQKESEGSEKQQAQEGAKTLSPETPSASAPTAHRESSVEGPPRKKLRGTAAMDAETRREVARKGGLAVSRNRQHMSEIGRKGGQSVSKNREHMAQIGKKGGEASRGSRG